MTATTSSSQTSRGSTIHNHVHGTNNHLVYSFDIEGPIAVNFHDVREATAADKKKFDRDEDLTLIRELFFLRDERDNLQTTKFQVGDEVIFGNARH